jgi:hypothetical protein
MLLVLVGRNSPSPFFFSCFLPFAHSFFRIYRALAKPRTGVILIVPFPGDPEVSALTTSTVEMMMRKQRRLFFFSPPAKSGELLEIMFGVSRQNKALSTYRNPCRDPDECKGIAASPCRTSDDPQHPHKLVEKQQVARATRQLR